MITVKRKILSLVGVATLTSCVTIQNYNNVPQTTSAGCSQMVLPELKAIPEVPDITPAQLSNRKETDRILIRHISDLRKQLKDLHVGLQSHYDRHVQTCMKNYGTP